MKNLENKKNKTNKLLSAAKTSFNGSPNYYFHSDDDFREDWNWGKTKAAASKAVAKREDQFESD